MLTVINMACLSVDIYVSVCLHTYLRNHMSKICQILFACYLWPWLSLPSSNSIVIYSVLSGVDDSCLTAVCSCTLWPGIGDARIAYRLHAQGFNTVAYAQTEGTALDHGQKLMSVTEMQQYLYTEQFTVKQKLANLHLICSSEIQNCFQL